MTNLSTISIEADIDRRVRTVQEEMASKQVDGCLIASSVNIFYLTGVIYTGFLFIPAEGEVLHLIKRAGHQLPKGHKAFVSKPEQIADNLRSKEIDLPRKLFLETDVLSYNTATRIATSLDTPEICNISNVMRQIRSVKSDYEIAQIRYCAKQHEAVYQAIPSLYKKGMTDIDLQIEIEREMRKHGSIGLFRGYGSGMEIFMGSLLAGNNAQEPSPFDFALGGAGMSEIAPLGANGTPLAEGCTIMVDMAGNFSPWMTDMTRVYSVGKVSKEAYLAHQVSIDIHDDIINAFHKEMPCCELWNRAWRLVEKHNLQPYFMGTKSQAKFVGHGVGLEINEPPVLTPRSKEVLKERTVFALEPKFVISDVGAVGIENTYLVTSKGLECITLFPNEIIPLA